MQNHIKKTKRFFFLCEAVIDPPTVSLAGCGNCIHVRVSLPAADNSSGVDDIHKFYRPTYTAVYKEHGGKVSMDSPEPGGGASLEGQPHWSSPNDVTTVVAVEAKCGRGSAVNHKSVIKTKLIQQTSVRSEQPKMAFI